VLSVIVSMFNERSTIATALDRVRRAETLGLRKELLVVGDGSTDGTREWLQHAQGDGLKAVSHLFHRGRATHRLRGGHGRCW
jgi:glycosyltransferase involved in cell wall biosynthesis